MVLQFYPKYMDSHAWANSVDPDQTAPLGAVWSGSTLFAIHQALLDTSPGSRINLF